jgi:hypothetical protein
MQVWTIAKALATTGAPSLASQIPCRAAEFHETLAFVPVDDDNPIRGAGATIRRLKTIHRY